MSLQIVSKSIPNISWLSGIVFEYYYFHISEHQDQKVGDWVVSLQQVYVLPEHTHNKEAWSLKIVFPASIAAKAIY